jgi:hypothetical protein
MNPSSTHSLSFANIPNVVDAHGHWTFTLRLDPWEHLQLVDREGRAYSNINVIPLFPLTAPEHGICILNEDFEELLCIGDISEVTQEVASMLKQELAYREFVPVILRVISVSGKTEPCEWIVETNHGRTRFVLKAEEDVHRISNKAVNIIDANGMRFRVEDIDALDRRSRAFVEWYV